MNRVIWAVGIAVLAGSFLLPVGVAQAEESEGSATKKDVPATFEGLPLVFEEDFEKGAERWVATDSKAWKIVEKDGNSVYNQFKMSDYQPPVRSPHNISRIKDLTVSDFVVEARMEQTSRLYAHRDMCIFFGYRDPSHFYYVHIATQADPHANSVFIVDGKARLSIAKERNEGNDWTTGFHTVRVVRDTKSGSIEVYFDDLENPVMRAVDKTFLSGGMGFGSFDDSGNIDDVRIWGLKE